jgi:hypothetical protein
LLLVVGVDLFGLTFNNFFHCDLPAAFDAS